MQIIPFLGADEHQVTQWPPRPMQIVLSSVSSDSHTWNLVFLQLLLEFMGHRVHNLGACTPDELIISTCLERRPDLLVISSVNGHGNIDGERLIHALRAVAPLRRLPVVLGGKLGVSGAGNTEHVDRLLRAGFSSVFEASTSNGAFEAFVERVSAQVSCLDLAEAAS
jgi:methylmalonyl-CoA mutase cobalamin-binding subunit